MPTVVTLEAILKGVDYPPIPGTEYMISPGRKVTLKEPFIELQEEFARKAQVMERQRAAALREAQALGEQMEYAEADTIPSLLEKLAAAEERLPQRPNAQLARLVTTGEWPENGYFDKVAIRILEDFRDAATGTSRRPQQ